MKAENIYTEVLRIEKALIANDAESVISILQELKASAEAEIRAEANKRNGNKNVEKACLRILKNASTVRPVLQKAYTRNEVVFISDGYSLVAMKKDVAPELPQNNPEENYPDFTQILKTTSGNTVEITPPSIDEIKSYISIMKAEEKAKPKNERAPSIKYMLANGQKVNPSSLLNMLEALPNAKIFTHSHCGSYPLYFTAKNGEGVLCVYAN